MPKVIGETERHVASRRAQMEMLIDNPNVWLRIDKRDGSIMPVTNVDVRRAAQGAYTMPHDVMATGRFQTTFAVYSTADKLTAEERQAALS
jgi:hypothetical protein